MAFWKRRSRQFEPVSPRTKYTVTYLGREEMKGKVGLDHTIKPVDNLYRNYKLQKAKAPSKMEIEIVNNGIRVEPLDAGVRMMFANSPYFVAEGPFGNAFFPINKLSFGAADPFHSKVFCFVSRNEDPARGAKWDCHAVVCESSAMAKNLTLYLVKAFQKTADSKEGRPFAGKTSQKTTIVHVLQERGTTEHQRLSKKKGKRPPVSTLKVTLNVEGDYEQIDSKQLDNNKQVADIIARQRSVRDAHFGDAMLRDPKDNENKNVSVGTNSSDKENEIMDGIVETDNGGESPREIVVTIAVNPELESPRKASTGEAPSSEEDDDGDGNVSPQAMITTMSPPDTPGYLSKEKISPSLTLQKGNTDDTVLHVTSSVPQSTKIASPSQGELDTVPSVLANGETHSAISPESPAVASEDAPARQGTATHVATRRVSPTPISPVKNDADETKDGVTGVLKRDSPSPPNTPSPSPSPQSPSSGQTTTSTKAAEKKMKRERKSVRFADDFQLID